MIGIVFVCLLIAAGISGIIMMIIKSSLKSVQQERTACNYVRNNSLKITNQSDTFSHENVTTTPRAQKQQSTSSGRPGTSTTRPASSTSTTRPTTRTASKPSSSTRTPTRRK